MCNKNWQGNDLNNLIVSGQDGAASQGNLELTPKDRPYRQG